MNSNPFISGHIKLKSALLCFTLNALAILSIFGLFGRHKDPIVDLAVVTTWLREEWDQNRIDSACKDSSFLCPLFLGYKTKLPSKERQALQQSGLAHLVAISGGQLAPLIGIATLTLGASLFSFFSLHFIFRNLRILAPLNLTSLILTSAYLSFFLGASGALLRALFVRAPEAWNMSHNWLHTACFRWLCLVFLGLVLGNPFLDISFALSSLGAAIAVVCIRAIGLAWRHFDLPRGQEGLFMRAFFATVLTSAAMTLALLPFTGALPRFEIPVLANVFAVPWVGWIVTPLAALKMILIGSHIEPGGLINTLFNNSLQVFDSIARNFSLLTETNQTTKADSSQTNFFTGITKACNNGHFATLLALCWGFSDTLYNAKLKMLQSRFQEIKLRKADYQNTSKNLVP